MNEIYKKTIKLTSNFTTVVKEPIFYKENCIINFPKNISNFSFKQKYLFFLCIKKGVKYHLNIVLYIPYKNHLIFRFEPLGNFDNKNIEKNLVKYFSLKFGLKNINNFLQNSKQFQHFSESTCVDWCLKFVKKEFI